MFRVRRDGSLLPQRLPCRLSSPGELSGSFFFGVASRFLKHTIRFGYIRIDFRDIVEPVRVLQNLGGEGVLYPSPQLDVLFLILGTLTRRWMEVVLSASK